MEAMDTMEIYASGHYYDPNHISYRTLINYIIGELEKNTHFPKWGRQTLEEIFSKRIPKRNSFENFVIFIKNITILLKFIKNEI